MEFKNLKDSMVFKPDSLTKKIVLDTPEVLCFILNLQPGQTIPVHKHEHSVLIATVLAGSCVAEVNGAKHDLSVHSALIVKGEDDFGIPQVTVNLSLYVTLSPNPSNPIFAKGIE
jgi:hypothetical protein